MWSSLGERSLDETERSQLTPGVPSHVYTVITAVALKDLSATIVNAAQDYHALAQNNRTELTIRNPFAFTLEALRAGGRFILSVDPK